METLALAFQNPSRARDDHALESGDGCEQRDDPFLGGHMIESMILGAVLVVLIYIVIKFFE